MFIATRNWVHSSYSFERALFMCVICLYMYPFPFDLSLPIVDVSTNHRAADYDRRTKSGREFQPIFADMFVKIVCNIIVLQTVDQDNTCESQLKYK